MRRIEVAHRIHKDIALVCIVVAISADLHVLRLLFLHLEQFLPESGNERKRAQRRLGFGTVRLDQYPLSFHLGFRYSVPDGQSVPLKIDRTPLQSQHLATPQTVKGCHLNDQCVHINQIRMTAFPNAYFEKVLDEEPENAYAYLGKIFVEKKTCRAKIREKEYILLL